MFFFLSLHWQAVIAIDATECGIRTITNVLSIFKIALDIEEGLFFDFGVDPYRWEGLPGWKGWNFMVGSWMDCSLVA
jgi:hypothetical protein